MNAPRSLERAAFLLLLASFIGLPIFLISEGESFWYAVGAGTMATGVLTFILCFLWTYVGVPLGLIAKTVKQPEKNARRRADQIAGWACVLIGCACIWWGYHRQAGEILALGTIFIVAGAGFLGGAWRTDRS